MVKIGYEKYIKPTKSRADFVVPNTLDGINKKAIQMIVNAVYTSVKA
jgi:uridine kinase